MHAEDGSRIACGILEVVDESEYLSADTAALTEPASGIGSVVVYPLNGDDEGRVCFLGRAVDLEPNLVSFQTTAAESNNNTINGDCTAENGCGAHVHAGTDCTNTTTQMGHFYDSAALDTDPWSTIGYLTTNDEGLAYFVGCLEPKAVDVDYDGRAFILHSNNGTRVSCGLLQRGDANTNTTTLAPTMSPGVTAGMSSPTASSVASLMHSNMFVLWWALGIVAFVV